METNFAPILANLCLAKFYFKDLLTMVLELFMVVKKDVEYIRNNLTNSELPRK